MIGLLSILAAAFAIDVNDQVGVELSGGEVVEGWFVRARPQVVTLHVPSLGHSVDIDLSLVDQVSVNGTEVDVVQFSDDLDGWYLSWTQWLENTPSPPPPMVVGLAGVPLAGTGHAWLGDWRSASGMMVADALGMSVLTWELQNNQRLNVVSGALAVSLVMKFYAATNGARKARTERRRRNEGRAR